MATEDRSRKRFRSSDGPLRSKSLRVDAVTDDGIEAVASTLGLSYNAVANTALSQWLTGIAPQAIAQHEAKLSEAASEAAELIRRLSGEDTNP